jgi:hypothetical protein
MIPDSNPDIVAVIEVLPKNCSVAVEHSEIALSDYDLFSNIDKTKGRGVVFMFVHH